MSLSQGGGSLFATSRCVVEVVIETDPTGRQGTGCQLQQDYQDIVEETRREGTRNYITDIYLRTNYHGAM
jgi:hypothetical protein